LFVAPGAQRLDNVAHVRQAAQADGPVVPKPKVRWTSEPQAHDYPAALDYLSLAMPGTQADALVEAMRSATTVERKAKDILRASRLAALGETNVHVAKDLAKIKAGSPLSPILLVRGDVQSDVPLTIADGYHRVCASLLVDEDTAIPCRIADLPGDGG
jgi:hypothetical protein